jgi:hypothetical protein
MQNGCDLLTAKYAKRAKNRPVFNFRVFRVFRGLSLVFVVQGGPDRLSDSHILHG